MVVAENAGGKRYCDWGRKETGENTLECTDTAAQISTGSKVFELVSQHAADVQGPHNNFVIAAVSNHHEVTATN